MQNLMYTLLPFLRWFPITQDKIRADLLAGITVALILVPQSMAYAQLAGLPVVYGLYASFVPVIIASLWGSSSQLHTGPVAMLSLMSAAALIPFATPGSASFIELSIMLALMVGVLRLALGIFKLGSIVNMLSSPVIVGFTNAAALIIGLSQLSKIIGVPFPRTESYLADLWRVVEQVPQIHISTFIFAVTAWILISGLRRVSSAIPGVLIVVVLTTLVSSIIGYEKKVTIDVSQIYESETAELLERYNTTEQRIATLITEIAELKRSAEALEKRDEAHDFEHAAKLLASAAVANHELKILKKENTRRRIEIHSITFTSALDDRQQLMMFSGDTISDNYQVEDDRWRFAGIQDHQIILSAGGSVVGVIPEGLPSFQTPTVQWDLVLALLPAALVMALIGFMEATSISKAIASSTGERVDASKELVGQGLANIAGSFFGSFTVSGSFSRSAVAAKIGAKTGLFAIISATAVVLVLLFFTPYLYHLPQAVLAVIVMMAVFSLIRIKPLTQAWKVDRVGAVIGIVTFIATLIMAPSIANGILLGVALTVIHYLIRTMKPRAEIVSYKPDGTLGGIASHNLTPISDQFVPVRFDGSLTFANVAYFEDIILKALRKFPDAKAIVMIGSGINEMDASGEEKIRELNIRLAELGVKLMFSGLKHQVMKLLDVSGLVEEIGKDRFFSDKKTALKVLIEQYGTSNTPKNDDAEAGKQ
ncbi:MAG: SulP family inorganic anion transporter [Gammaproteobacteria bacterium]|nr:SulP family inorganic anion transporter [Gammaproteobacteria bacterium]NNJ50469.1 STAS domain-containing protein [Gammaproteobacteria bacterium]